MYRLLDAVSPVDFDCGTLCGSICCTCDSLSDSEDILLQDIHSVHNPTYNNADSQNQGLNVDISTDTGFHSDRSIETAEDGFDVDDEYEDDTLYDEGLGIYLYPGEDRVFTKQEDWLAWEKDDVSWYDFPDSWTGTVWFVRCLKAPHCDRPKRPLQCRFYPLAPHITEDGEVVLIWSTEDVPYVCPLIRDRVALNRDFIKATHTVCRHLARDPRIFDLFAHDSKRRLEDGAVIEVVYPR